MASTILDNTMNTSPTVVKEIFGNRSSNDESSTSDRNTLRFPVTVDKNLDEQGKSVGVMTFSTNPIMTG